MEEWEGLSFTFNELQEIFVWRFGHATNNQALLVIVMGDSLLINFSLRST
jgi:hypothetical protein